MNVLHVTPAYYPATYWGGPIFSVLGLNKALADIPGVHLRVLTTDSAGPTLAQRLPTESTSPVSYSPGYKVYFCRRLAGADISPGLLTRLMRLARWADVIHLTATYSFPTIPTLLVARILGRPIVWSPRGALQASYEWAGARRRLAKRVWERTCNGIVKGQRCVLHVTSEAERYASLARIPNASAEIIRNGVDVPDALPSRVWCPDGNLRLMFLGRLDRKKGIDDLLRAVQLLQEEKLSLEICGTGDRAYVHKLEELATRLGIANKVRFVGQVDGAERLTAFMRADLCVVPSHNENFCMVVAEALAHGVPVIASTGTPWKAVIERGCGDWVDNDPDTLASAIRRARPRNLAELGQAGRRWMTLDYSWQAVAAEMYGLYKTVCSPA